MPLKPLCRGDNFEASLAGFAAALREAGLRPGTAELIDAFQALQEIDLSRRADFKTALSASLVKNHRDQEEFNRVFDSFFMPAEVIEQQHLAAKKQQRMIQRDLEKVNRSLQFKGEPLNLSPEEMMLYARLPADRQEGLLRFVRETESGNKVEGSFRPVLETVVKGHLRYCRGKVEKELSAEEVGSGGSGGAGRGSGIESRLRRVDIQAIKETDLPAAEALIRKLSRQIGDKLSRRQRSSAKRGPLDLRLSLRRNMRFGGIVFNLAHKRKRPHRQQVVVFCDVSASMQRYSTFVLQFIYGLQAAVFSLESFCFSDDLEYLSPDLRQHGNIQQILDRVVTRGQAWGGGTNLGVALENLLERHAVLLNSRVTLLIVSDTRTISLERSLQALQRVRQQVGRIIWLNPLPPEQWPHFRSVEAVGEIVEMWPCHTIEYLEQAVSGRFYDYRHKTKEL